MNNAKFLIHLIMDIKILLKNYLDYLEIEKNRSPKTRRNYEHYLKSFLNFAEIKNEKNITSDAVRDFRLYLARRKTEKNEIYKKILKAIILSP